MPTWDEVHAGDIVLLHDNLLYGVAEIDLRDAYGPRIVLRRHGSFLSAQPPAGTHVTIVHRADTSDLAAAWQLFADAGFGPQLLGEFQG